MDKYIIINKDFNSVICKSKNGGRHYRQNIDNIDKNLVIVQTTKGRAEAERDYLNKEYNQGWGIEKVEPIVFTDNEARHEEYLTEYATLRKSEIDQVRKETAKEILQKIKARSMWFIESQIQEDHFVEQIKELAKEYYVEIEND